MDIFQPATLPCGRVVRNRLVKAAMYEHLATLFGGPPNNYHLRLYSEWAKHEWGIVLTGNVQVSPDHLTLGRDIILPRHLSMPKDEDLEPFRRLADIIHGGRTQFEADDRRTLAILQLSHAGRQSANILGGRRILQRPMAPSPIKIGSSPARKASIVEEFMNTILFQKPMEMTKEDILHVTDRFVHGSVFAHKAGFDGVQLHVAHGYLLSQFISTKTNLRTDTYSCDKALDLIQSIVARIRALTPKDFVISIKISAADYTSSESSNSSLTEHEQSALHHLLTIASWGTIDIIEVSGGDYETPSFLTSERSQCNSMRQTFFTRFSRQAVKALSSLSTSCDPSTRPLILLTGGLRTPALLSKALALKHADLLGIGRAAVRSPEIPTILKSQLLKQPGGAADNDAPFQPEPNPNAIHLNPPARWLWKILMCMKLIGAGGEMAWHVLAIRNVAVLPMTEGPTRPNLDYTLGALHCVLMMFLWRLPTSDRQRSGRPT